ncbi:MAG TPA: hypothetical protein ENK15_00320 [Thermopetrobacter sp.]|nr:hypothetical protein [Thermopetrobacter sp.]
MGLDMVASRLSDALQGRAIADRRWPAKATQPHMHRMLENVDPHPLFFVITGLVPVIQCGLSTWHRPGMGLKRCIIVALLAGLPEQVRQ